MDELLLKQDEIIVNLTALCSELLKELAQYKSIEQEENMLKELMAKEGKPWKI